MRSGASLDTLASPYRPAFVGMVKNGNFNSAIWGPNTLSQDGSYGERVLFAFGSPAAAAAGPWGVALLRDGRRPGRRQQRPPAALRPAGKPDRQAVAPGRGRRAHAGRTRHRRQRQPLGPLESSPFPFSYSYTNNLFIHDQASDVSLVRAGRDIIAGSFTVAGPGTLEISAGRNIQMLDQAAVLSLGPVVPGDTRPGAGIAMQAGLGAQGADYAGFLRRYLDPSRVADPSRPLTDQGLPFKTYEHELLLWLTQVWLRRQHQRRARLLRRAAARAAARVRAPGLLRRAARRRPRVQRQVQPAPGQLPARPPGHRRSVPGARCRRRLCRRHHHVWRRGRADARRRRHPGADARRRAGLAWKARSRRPRQAY